MPITIDPQAPEVFETRLKMAATAQNVAFKVDLRRSRMAGRYVLDGVLFNNGSASLLQVRDQTGVAGEIQPNQPIMAALKPSGLSFVVVPLDAAGVTANQVMLFLKWRKPRVGENVF